MMTALADIVRIVSCAAIAQAQVKITVRSKQHRSAVMVPIRLGNLEDDPFRGKIGLIRIIFRNLNFTQHTALGALLRVVKITKSVGLELRMKSEGQQTLFILHPRFSIADIEKRFHSLGFAAAGQNRNSSV